MTDDRLLDRFRREVMPVADRFFRLALAVVGVRQEAEDVVQDVMLRLWERRDSWTGIGSLEAWCTTAVRNAAIDRTRTRHELEALPTDDNRPASTPSPHDNMVAAEGRDAVMHILSGLPEVQRSVFVLREAEGKSYAEIAAILGLSDAQVKTYLLRARRRLRERFVRVEA